MSDVHICRFDSTLHVAGERGSGKRAKRTYEAVKEAALEAGRFSVFEATSNAQNAGFFKSLERDPEVIVDRSLGFPWIGVRRRGDAR